MIDITRLLASLKRRSAHAKEFGDSITFVKLKDIDALVEALEKAQQLETKDAEMVIQMSKRLAEAYKRIAELEESHAQVIQSRDHYKRISEEGLKQLAESSTVTVKLPDLRQVVSGDRYVWSDGVFNYSQDVKAELTAQGIKWEAE